MQSILRRDFPQPCVAVFVALQALDVLTTMIGLRMGAREGSMFIARILLFGPLTGLLISKVLAVSLVAIAFRAKRSRIVVFLNLWFAALITWNLVMILSVLVRLRN
jgi:hypothetical protein